MRLRPAGRLAIASSVLLAAASCSSPSDGGIRVTLSPTSPTVQVGGSVALTVTVVGADDPSVAWTSDCGTIEGSGSTITFTAPWGPGECTVTATSVDDTSQSASVAVTVDPIPASSNLLGGSGFEEDLAPFEAYPDATPRAVWSDDDARGSSTSGSAELSHPLPGNNATRLAMDYCFESGPGIQYRIGGSARLVEALAGTEVRILIGPADPGCGSFDLPETLFWAFPEVSTSWTSGSGTYTTPAGTTLVRVSVGIWKASGVDQAALARVDDLFVVEL